MNSKQANISANFENQIMNLLKKNKLTGFRSGAAAREAMMGGGVGGAVGLADAMKDDSSGKIPDDDKMSHYLKSILGYGTAGAGIGAGFGLKKGLRLKNQAAKSHLKDLLPGIEKELATGVDPTLMGEARKRVLKQIEEHHPAMDYETFMENLANEKAHAPVADKKPGFFERRDINREADKARTNFDASRAEQASNAAAQTKADEAMTKVESNLAPAKRSVEDIIKERQVGEPGSKSKPSGSTPLAPGKAGAGFKPLSKDTIPGNAPAAIPAAPPENIFQKMHREVLDEQSRYLNHLQSGGAPVLGHHENLMRHKEDIGNFARKVGNPRHGSSESLEDLYARTIKNHDNVMSGTGHIPYNEPQQIKVKGGGKNKKKLNKQVEDVVENEVSVPAPVVNAADPISGPQWELTHRGWQPPGWKPAPIPAPAVPAVPAAEPQAAAANSPFEAMGTIKRRRKITPSDARAADERAQAAAPPTSEEEHAALLNMSLAKLRAMKRSGLL